MQYRTLVSSNRVENLNKIDKTKITISCIREKEPNISQITL